MTTGTNAAGQGFEPPGLTARQAEAVECFDRPTLVLSPPGTGKTLVVVAKYKRCVAAHGHGSAIAITFTRKAAAEIGQRLAVSGCSPEWSPGDASWTRRLPTVGTFHAVANRILALAADAGLYDGPTVLATPGDLEMILASCVASAEPDSLSDRDGWGSRNGSSALQHALSRSKNEGYLPTRDGYAYVGGGRFEVVTSLPNPGSAMHSRMAAYQASLAEQRVLDYDDALIQAVLMVRQHRNRLLPDLRCVVVDEYQDSNPLNEMMIEALSAGRSLTCCGDDDQAIYRWRGARVEHIQRFEERHPGTKVVVLDQNFRSPPGIGILAERIMRSVPGRLPKASAAEVSAANDSIPLTVHEYRSRAPFFNPMSGAGEEDGIARFAAETCRSIVQAGASPSDIIVLVRKNSLAAKVKEAAGSIGMVARVNNPNALDSLELRSLLSWVRVLADPWSAGPVAQLTFTPATDGTFRDLRRIAASRSIPLPEYMCERLDAGKARNPRFAEFAATYRQLRAILDAEGPAAAADAACNHIARSTYAATDEARIAHFWASYARMLPALQSGGGLRAAIEILQSHASDDDQDAPGALEVSTIHSVKGRQKPIVVLAAMADGIMPSKPAVQAGPRSGDMMEERRLAFVAITRAMREVHVISVAGAKCAMLDSLLGGQPLPLAMGA